MKKQLNPRKEYYKQYDLKRREKRKEYRKSRKIIFSQYLKEYDSKPENKRRRSMNISERKRKYKNSWKEYFSHITNCQICNTHISFDSGNQFTSVAFDHRHEGQEVIKLSPLRWIETHIFNDKHKTIWESCDFGYLCHNCNRCTPTLNRKQFVNGLVKYINL